MAKSVRSRNTLEVYTSNNLKQSNKITLNIQLVLQIWTLIQSYTLELCLNVSIDNFVKEKEVCII